MKGRLSHLLDTSVYSQRLRPVPSPRVVERWQQVGDERLAVSAICEAELLFGLRKRGSERLWQEYRTALADRLTVLPIDPGVAGIYAELKADCESRGEPRADFDLLIAATALRHRLILATGNSRHFNGLHGLEVEDWFAPDALTGQSV